LKLAIFAFGFATVVGAQEPPAWIPPMRAPTSASIADDTSLDAPTFLGFYLWTQALWQYVDDGKDGFTLERGDIVGGRLVGGMGLGRFGVELRADVSGLKEQFKADDPATYTTLEVFAGAHFVAYASHGAQVGPIIAAGTVANKQSPDGIALSFYGGGARFAGYGAEVHALVARHDYLPLGGWRMSLSAHIPVSGKLYAVGDIVMGRDGYARVGIAVRMK